LERLAHAYLLVGPEGVGKMTLALDLARAVNCLGADRPCGECDQCARIDRGVHVDVRIVGVGGPQGGDGRARVAIGIDQVREAQREAGLKPYEGAYRVFIVNGAERLSDEAANSILKFLEEPPGQAILVLLASDDTRLLPTIVSRCMKLELRPLPADVVAVEIERRFDLDGERAKELARLSGGLLGWAIRASREPRLTEAREEALAAFEEALEGDLERRFSFAAEVATAFGRDRESVGRDLDLWLSWWRDVLMVREGLPAMVTNLSRTDGTGSMAETLSSEQIGRAMKAVRAASDHLASNVNPRLALEELMLVLPRP
jgi:DNA polymerase-3 subunit delta'